jgi:hypothetical protein
MATHYASRFVAMVEELKGLPFVEVLQFAMGSPAAGNQLDAAEKRLGGSMSAAIRGFYAEMNGLDLAWRIRLDTSHEELKRLRALSDDYELDFAESENYRIGRINLVPIEQSILGEPWSGVPIDNPTNKTRFNGRDYAYSDARTRVRPLDLFSPMAFMCLFIEEGNGDPPVFLIDEDVTDWSSAVTNFESYVEFLLVTRGLREAKLNVFSAAEGQANRRLVHSPEEWSRDYTPKLFRAGNKRRQ